MIVGLSMSLRKGGLMTRIERLNAIDKCISGDIDTRTMNDLLGSSCLTLEEVKMLREQVVLDYDSADAILEIVKKVEPLKDWEDMLIALGYQKFVTECMSMLVMEIQYGANVIFEYKEVERIWKTSYLN